jgi:hypothetical protein
MSINYFLFSPRKFPGLAIFHFFFPFSFSPFLSFLFLSLYFWFFFLTLEHLQVQRETEPVGPSSSAPSHGAPSPGRTPSHVPLSPSSFLISPLSGKSPWRLPWSSNSSHGCPPMESLNQAHFSSCDDQNRCTRPPSCYPRPQFYPKWTLISGFCGISFFN